QDVPRLVPAEAVLLHARQGRHEQLVHEAARVGEEDGDAAADVLRRVLERGPIEEEDVQVADLQGRDQRAAGGHDLGGAPAVGEGQGLEGQGGRFYPRPPSWVSLWPSVTKEDSMRTWPPALRAAVALALAAIAFLSMAAAPAASRPRLSAHDA